MHHGKLPPFCCFSPLPSTLGMCILSLTFCFHRCSTSSMLLHSLLLPSVSSHLVLFLLLSLVLYTFKKCKTCHTFFHISTFLAVLFCKLRHNLFQQSSLEPRTLGHKSLEFELLGHCIFCFVLFTDCKSLSFQTSLWHDNDSEEVGASFHASSLEQ
jgi:hypothetical protein